MEQSPFPLLKQQKISVLINVNTAWHSLHVITLHFEQSTGFAYHYTAFTPTHGPFLFCEFWLPIVECSSSSLICLTNNI